MASMRTLRSSIIVDSLLRDVQVAAVNKEGDAARDLVSIRPMAWFACSSSICNRARSTAGRGGSGGGTNARTASP